MQVPHGQTGAHAHGDGVPKTRPGTRNPFAVMSTCHWPLQRCRWHFDCATDQALSSTKPNVVWQKFPGRGVDGCVVPRLGQRRSKLRNATRRRAFLEPGVVWRQPVRAPPLPQRSEVARYLETAGIDRMWLVLCINLKVRLGRNTPFEFELRERSWSDCRGQKWLRIRLGYCVLLAC
jgi:hypothetical protein